VYLLLLRNFYFVNHLNNTKSQQILNLHFLIIVVRLLLPWFCAWCYQYLKIYVGNLRQMSFQISIFKILSCSFVLTLVWCS
jgi:hypothetical protein